MPVPSWDFELPLAFLTKFFFLTLLLSSEFKQNCREEVLGYKPLAVPWRWSSLDVEGDSWQGSFPQSSVCKEQINENVGRYGGIGACAVLGLSVFFPALAFSLTPMDNQFMQLPCASLPHTTIGFGEQLSIFVFLWHSYWHFGNMAVGSDWTSLTSCLEWQW